MPWQSFIPWSNSLKTRACRQLIHHYLGVFFQEKLSLDQLSVDLFSGRGQVKDVILNLNVISPDKEKHLIHICFLLLGFK
jgi:autophagy-related protein 2